MRCLNVGIVTIFSLLLGLFTAEISAEVLFFEDYNSYATGSLNGQGGWSNVPLGLGVCDVTSDEIYVGGGNAVYSSTTSYDQPGKALPSSLDVRSTTTYLSKTFAVREQGTNTSGFAVIGLGNSNSADNKMEIRVTPNQELITVTGDGDYYQTYVVEMVVGKIYRLVVKITPYSGNFVYVTVGVFDVTTGGLLDESSYAYQVNNFIFDRVPDYFSYVFSGHRYDLTTSDDLLVSTTWEDIQLVVPDSAIVYAHSPSPANNAIDVDISSVLDWSVENNNPMPTAFDVYFSTNSDFTSQSPVSVGQQATSYDPFDAEPMQYETTYHWRIDGYQDGLPQQGEVWSFTTMESPCDNLAPVISEMQTIYTSTRKPTTINMFVSDDNKPYVEGCDPYNPQEGTPYAIAYQWTQTSGPADAILSPETGDSREISAVFLETGTYQFTFTATDGPDGIGLSSSSTVTVEVMESLPGDVNIDWRIGLDDLSLLTSQWLDGAVCSRGDTYCADLDQSGLVNLDDYVCMAYVCGQQPSFVISEFMASNNLTLKDNYDNRSDWIEIFNASSEIGDLVGWHLTDDPNDLNKWTFPSVTVEPGEHVIVYASGEDESDSESPVHPNFKLRTTGEYLALVSPDDVIVSQISPQFPLQVADISYGLTPAKTGNATLIDDSTQAEYLIAYSDALDDGSWVWPGFDDTGWSTASFGIGYDYGTLVATNVVAMKGKSKSVYIRIPFEIENPTVVSSLLLRMKYDDGFVAYINGVGVKRSGTVTSTDEYVPWNKGCNTHSDQEAVVFEDYSISLVPGQLQKGTNLLAIHGINGSATSSDFLIIPELYAVADSNLYSDTWRYMTSSTPGEFNNTGVEELGVVIRNGTESLPSPAKSDSIVIKAEIEETTAAVASVKAYYRVMYNSEASLTMYDNGAGNDAVAGDGIYTATIPAGIADYGEMVRWRFQSEDVNGVQFKLPAYLSADKSPQYYGTVIADPTRVTDLDVFQWFTSNFSGAIGDGARGSVFFKDNFYDNIFIRRRAKSSGISNAGKRCLKFDFNPGNGFYYNDEIPSAGEINLNNNKFDKSLITQILGMRTFKLAGMAYSMCDVFYSCVNGDFYGLQIFVEHPEDDYLKRNGLDEFGSLYKAEQDPWNDLQDGIVLASMTKKTREDEGRDEVVEFGEGVRTYVGTAGNSDIVPQADRKRYVYDNVDIAQVVNYTATMSIVHGNDHHAKNYYLYRDTEGTKLWWFLPWDLDMSYGHNFASLNNNMYADEMTGGHPLWGSSDYPRSNKTTDHWNGLIDTFMDVPEFRQMHLRRLRTLMDDILQPPGLDRSEYRCEAFMDEHEVKIASSVAVEIAKWAGDYSYGDATYYPSQQLDRIESLFLLPRRVHLFNTHNIANYTGEDNLDYCVGIPDEQTAGLTIDFGAYDASPASGDQDQEYIQLVNNNSEAVDISNWTLIGGVEHIFTPGTVIPAGFSMYVTPDVQAFLARTLSPRKQQDHFVQGNYNGHLSSLGETVELRDDDGILNNTLVVAADPSDAQRYLRITEIMYHPATDGDESEKEYEFIELKNIGDADLSIGGVELGGGVEFTFQAGTTLAAGEYVLVVENQSKFVARYGSGLPVAGQYSGALSNSGEQLTLKDPLKGDIHQFSYKDSWFTVTDGDGFSLVIIDENDAVIDNWDVSSSWRPSGQLGGSPGQSDVTIVPEPGAIIINEILAHTDLAPNDWVELYNTTNDSINIGGWYLSDDGDDLMKYQIPMGTVIASGGYVVFTQDDHFGQAMALSENGETLYLSSGQGGELTGYSESQSFDASLRAVSFGLYTTSTGDTDFVAMESQTPNASNSGPKVFDIVISEIMYNPIDPEDGRDNNLFEYIELYNRTGSPVSLEWYDENLSENVSWTFTNGIDYVFPAGTVIEAYGKIVIVADIDAFSERYPAVSSNVIYGPYSGKLSNGGEKLDLSMPGDEVSGERQYIRIERVNYDDGGLWPIAADGDGMALGRINTDQYSDDVANWQAIVPTPGM